MVDANVKQEGKRQVSPRKQRQLDRLQRLKANKPPATVRVVPRDDDIRRVMHHPNGMRFRSEGSIEWPNDSFTKRRIAEGDVKLEGKPDKAPKATKPPEPPPQPNQQKPDSAA